MRWSYNPEQSEVEAQLAKIEAQRATARQLERIADVLEQALDE